MFIRTNSRSFVFLFRGMSHAGKAQDDAELSADVGKHNQKVPDTGFFLKSKKGQHGIGSQKKSAAGEGEYAERRPARDKQLNGRCRHQDDNRFIRDDGYSHFIVRADHTKNEYPQGNADRYGDRQRDNVHARCDVNAAREV